MTTLSDAISLSEILASLDASAVTVGDTTNRVFTSVRKPDEATRSSIAFVDKGRPDKAHLVEETEAGLLFCDEHSRSPKDGQVYVVVRDPKLVFAKLIREFVMRAREPFVHPTAVIHPDAQIAPTACVGAYAVVGRASIGSHTVVHAAVVIHDGVTIGANVTINSGTVIGSEGFGYSLDVDGSLVNFPHLAGVTIEDDVEIGANTTIDRGGLSDTILRRGCVVDNLVHIAHNVVVGERAMVIANAMVGGSTTIGSGAWVAPSATLRDGIDVGAEATIGLASVVTKNVPPGETWTGSPAVPLQEFLAMRERLRRLSGE